MPQPTFKVKMSKEESATAHAMMADMLVAAKGLGGFLPGAEPTFQPPGSSLHITVSHFAVCICSPLATLNNLYPEQAVENDKFRIKRVGGVSRRRLFHHCRASWYKRKNREINARHTSLFRRCYTVEFFVQLLSQRIAESRLKSLQLSPTKFYFPQRFLQLVSQRFEPLATSGNVSCNLSRKTICMKKIAQCERL